METQIRITIASMAFILSTASASAQEIPPVVVQVGDTSTNITVRIVALNEGNTNAPQTEADIAWQAVLDAMEPPLVPESWRGKVPPPDERKKFQAEHGIKLGIAADKAKEFFTKYPNDLRVNEARMEHERLLQMAVEMGNTNRIPDLEKLEAARLKDPDTPEEDRVRIRLEALMRRHAPPGDPDPVKGVEAMEKVARELMKEFPKRDEPYELLASLLGSVSEAKTQALAKEILASNASAELKDRVKAALEKSIPAAATPAK